MFAKGSKGDKFLSAVSSFLRLNSDWLVALLVTAISLVFSLLTFYIVEFKELLGLGEDDRAYWIAIALAVFQLLITYGALFFYRSRSFLKKLFIWLQSNGLSLFIFLYYIRLNDSSLEIGSISLTTRFVVVILSILVFLVNYNLFGVCKKNLALVVSQVAFFIFTTFSFLSFAETDRSINKDFTSEMLHFVFHLHPLIWFIVTSVMISLVSIIPIGGFKKGAGRILGFFSLSTFVNFQILISVYFLEISELGEGRLTYWYLTLLALIFWDLFYYPMVNVIKDVIDYKFKQRVFVSTLYHLSLFALVLFYDPIIELFEKIITKWH